jgi:hypothetical protein
MAGVVRVHSVRHLCNGIHKVAAWHIDDIEAIAANVVTTLRTMPS